MHHQKPRPLRICIISSLILRLRLFQHSFRFLQNKTYRNSIVSLIGISFCFSIIAIMSMASDLVRNRIFVRFLCLFGGLNHVRLDDFFCQVLQSYNPEAYKELMEFVGRQSLNDGDQFCASMMRESSRHQSLGMHVVR